MDHLHELIFKVFHFCCVLFVLFYGSFNVEAGEASTVIGAIGGASPKPGNGESCIRKGI
jgi:hypothetical protein